MSVYKGATKVLGNEIVNGVKKSKYKPTTSGKLGDIVYRENPVPGMNIGWVYTEFGWLPFGIIANDNSECVDALNNNKPLYEWTHRINPDNAEDFTQGFYWAVEESDGSYTNKSKSELHAHIKKLSDVNGYRSGLACEGISANTNVFVLGNVPSQNGAAVNRPYSINWELVPVSGDLVKDDFKAIIEMDIAILTPTKNTNRPDKGYDVFEAAFFESTDGRWPYLGILDDRSEGTMRTSGNIDRNGTQANGLYRYLGKLPLDQFVTLKFVINGMDNVATYLDDCLIDTDLNNPYFKEEAPTGENLCNFCITFGDFDYFICREIRVKNLNPSRLKEANA